MRENHIKPIDGCFFRPLEHPYASATWEITNRCALHCLHCCTEARATGLPDELTFEEAKSALSYFASKWNMREIYFSGGEPFERPDFLMLCRHAATEGIRLCVATAGLPVTEAVAAEVAQLPFDFVHVSVDSPIEEDHDRFRGYVGSHQAAVRAIDALVSRGVEVRVGTVISHLNWRNLRRVAELCAEHGVRRLNFSMMLDAGRAKRTHKSDMLMSPEERQYAWQQVDEISAEFADRVNVDCRRTKTTTTDPLGGCPGATRLFHIDARGMIWPCSWIAKLLPQFHLGNARLAEPIPVSARMRYLDFLDSRKEWSGCHGCSESSSCGRGCPIAALLYSGDEQQRDPICERPVELEISRSVHGD